MYYLVYEDFMGDLEVKGPFNAYYQALEDAESRSYQRNRRIVEVIKELEE